MIARLLASAVLSGLAAMTGCTTPETPRTQAGAAATKAPAQSFRGKASYYAASLEGRSTASGEPYRHRGLTAAHRTLPFGTRVRVTNLANGRSVDLTINDRGPFVEGRVIDVSGAAAARLDMIQSGIIDVEVVVLP